MVKHVNFERDDVLKMPIFERRYYLQKYISELEAQQEAQKRAKESAKKK